MLQWTPVKVWIQALPRRRSHIQTTRSRPTSGPSHFSSLSLVFSHLYLRRVRYISESFKYLISCRGYLMTCKNIQLKRPNVSFKESGRKVCSYADRWFDFRSNSWILNHGKELLLWKERLSGINLLIESGRSHLQLSWVHQMKQVDKTNQILKLYPEVRVSALLFLLVWNAACREIVVSLLAPAKDETTSMAAKIK